LISCGPGTGENAKGEHQVAGEKSRLLSTPTRGKADANLIVGPPQEHREPGQPEMKPVVQDRGPSAKEKKRAKTVRKTKFSNQREEKQQPLLG